MKWNVEQVIRPLRKALKQLEGVSQYQADRAAKLNTEAARLQYAATDANAEATRAQNLHQKLSGLLDE